MNLLKLKIGIVLFLLCSVHSALAESQEKRITEFFESSLEIKKEAVYETINSQKGIEATEECYKSTRKALVANLSQLSEIQQLKYIWLLAAGLTDLYIQNQLFPETQRTSVLLTIYLSTLFEILGDDSRCLKFRQTMKGEGSYQNILRHTLNLLSIDTPYNFLPITLRSVVQASINCRNGEKEVEEIDAKKEKKEKRYVLEIVEFDRKKNEYRNAQLIAALMLTPQVYRQLVRYVPEDYKATLDVAFWAAMTGVGGFVLHSRFFKGSFYEQNPLYRNLDRYIQEVFRLETTQPGTLDLGKFTTFRD